MSLDWTLKLKLIFSLIFLMNIKFMINIKYFIQGYNSFVELHNNNLWDHSINKPLKILINIIQINE